MPTLHSYLCRCLVSACLLAWGGASCGANAPDVTAIIGATVIHPERGPSEAATPDTTVIIVGNRIQSVGPTYVTAVPTGARIIDGRGKWLIPGLIDAHVHFDQSGSLYARPDIADFTSWMPYPREQARNRARLPATLRAWLASGVTGVVDIGGPNWTFEVREIARRTAEAPRVAVAGPLVSMVARPQLDLGDPPIVRVRTPEEARALVVRTLRQRPDWIKVWFIHHDGDDLAVQEAIVKAAGDEAHNAGVRLAVHATELKVAKAALRAGADYLVHSVEDEPIDQEFIDLAKKRKVLYCPTLFVYAGYGLALVQQLAAYRGRAAAGGPCRTGDDARSRLHSGRACARVGAAYDASGADHQDQPGSACELAAGVGRGDPEWCWVPTPATSARCMDLWCSAKPN